jgi:hypothetical protein
MNSRQFIAHLRVALVREFAWASTCPPAVLREPYGYWGSEGCCVLEFEAGSNTTCRMVAVCMEGSEGLSVVLIGEPDSKTVWKVRQICDGILAKEAVPQ